MINKRFQSWVRAGESNNYSALGQVALYAAFAIGTYGSTGVQRCTYRKTCSYREQGRYTLNMSVLDVQALNSH